MTLPYLEAIYGKKLWVPQYSEIRLKPCPRLPQKKVLLQLLLEACRDKHELGIVEGKKEPNTQWMLFVLSTVAPTSRIFDKGYTPEYERRIELQKQVRDKQVAHVENPEFWIGQPLFKGKKSASTVLNKLLGN